MNHIETTIWISHYPNLIVQIVLHIQIIPIPVGKECLLLKRQICQIEKLKIEVIKRTIKLNDGIVKLSSIHLINPHFDLTNQVGNLYFVDYLDMMFIIVANSSCIIGFNVVLFVSGETVSPNMEWSKCETLNK